jgi:polyisoprenyl-teichoic acid--peptidoglycan teichoic acid transferase
MNTRIIPFILLISTLAASCNFPTAIQVVAPVASGVSQNLLYSPTNPTATPTPFQPQAPTPTLLPTDTSQPATPQSPKQAVKEAPKKAKPVRNFPGPSVYPDYPIPSPANPIDQPNGQINILLLGSDQRFGDGGFRTDTIVLLTVNPNKKKITFTSFPRDLYTYIPGWTMQRINTALAHGGFETLQMTMAYNFGVWPDYYVLINLWTFVDLIDDLGGVDVEVASSLNDTYHGKWVTIPVDVNHMDGEKALWYARSRQTSSDFERTHRQQEVLEAIGNRILSLYGISQAPKLFKTYSKLIETNMTISDLLPLLPVASQSKNGDKVNHYYIGREQVTSWMTPSGAAVLLPNQEAVMKVMKEALQGK